MKDSEEKSPLSNDEKNKIEIDSYVEKGQKILKFSVIPNHSAFNLYMSYGNLLAIAIGATPLMMSFITAITNLGQSVLQGIWGRISDLFGRKIVLVGSFASIAISVLLLSSLNNPIWYMIIVGFLSISFSASTPAWNALHGDLSTEKNRTKFISQVAMIGSFSSSLFSLVAGFLVDILPFSQLVKYRSMLLIASILFAITAIIFLFLNESPALLKLKHNRYSFITPFRDKKYRTILIATLIWYFVMSFLWPLYPYVVYGLKPTTVQIAIFSLSHTTGLLISQWVAGKIADLIGRRFTIFISYAIIASVPFILAFTNLTQLWYLIIFSNLIAGISNGLVGVALNSEILNLAPRADMRGTYSGTYYMVQGIFTFTGSFASGLIFERITPFFGFNKTLTLFLFILSASRLIASIPSLLISISENQR